MGGVLVPFLTDWGKISLNQVLLLQSWFMFWIFALEVPTGVIADRFGRKWSIVASVICLITAVFIYTSKPSFTVFMLAEFVWALAGSLQSGAEEALIYDTLEEKGESGKSKKIFGRMESMDMAGLMIAAPLGSLIAAHFGLRVPMLAMVLPLTIALLIACALEEPVSLHKETRKNYFEILKNGTRFFREHRVLKILAFDMISIGSITYFWVWLYQPLLRGAGLNIAYFGLAHAALVAIQILVMNNFERLENILGSKKNLIFFTALATGVMLILAGLTTSIPLLLIAITIGAGLGLARRPLFINYMNKYIPSQERATVLSSISMIRTFMLVVLNPIVGQMVNWSLHFTTMTLGALAILFAFISKVEEDHLID